MANANEVVRPLANYPPDIWGDRFLSLSFNNSEFESCSKQVEVLKASVKDMLIASTIEPIEQILVINSICRLGISYHFESEIEEKLSHLFNMLPKLADAYNDHHDHDLHTIAVIFQVFRSNGYKMTCDVFNKFKGSDGKFNEELMGNNIKGIISMYEASHFRMNGEHILDEALALTKMHLEKSLANQSLSCHVKEYISNALNRPYHQGMPRIEARQYITFYEKDETTRNNEYDTLLKLAKCDFNRVQMLHQQELKLVSSWWKELNAESRFPYARHRIVESLFSAVAISFEPCYARSREIFAKLMIYAIVDDVYDAYGTYQELQCFTDAIQRFDIGALDELPADYFKMLYETVINAHDEAEKLVREEGRSYGISYAKNELKKFAKAHQVEARWRHEGYLPTFDEYLENAFKSSGGTLGVSLALAGMEEADENAFEWLINSDYKVPQVLNKLVRFLNDIVTNERKRGDLFSGTICYMKQYGVSRKEAIQGYRKRLEEAWKDFNEGCMRPAPVSMQILRRALNYVRLIDVGYRNDEEFTKPEISFKHHITKVLIDPVPL